MERYAAIKRDIAHFEMMLVKSSKRYESGYKACIERLYKELEQLQMEAN